MSIHATAFKTLELQRVARDFGGQSALANLSLSISSGEFIALLGPSGCGKSTALNCLAGLLPLTGGRILMDGRQIDRLPPEKRGFGMVFQNYALFPHLTVEKNIAFGLEMRKVPRAEIKTRVAEAIELVQLGPHARKLPGQMSGGQQQRVAIARAVVLRPPLVLMDEPLSNLDAKLRLEMRTEIRRLHQSLGLTTIYVTHDQEEALSLADRLVVLRQGEVQQVGTPQDLHEHPANWHVADFMGYRNLLDGVVEQTRGGSATVSVAGTGITGSTKDPVAPGDAVKVGIRPEDFDIAGSLTAADGTTQLEATVEVVEYQGREFAVEARTDAGQALHIRTHRRAEPGQRIIVSARHERVLVFASSMDSGTPAGRELQEATP
ncbi:ABC transporter ATP-binding protein [Arthrobacter sp. zg-Y238]|uniref:ABC transporter ATP-binding protein n=1 Tax=Arthrobacter sp. zg-Y238 TaxID=2964614 RepID=UPI002104149B|nr:ABC transporter ATP-binding protein [Arthrobacter sp. zg-Y238]MCQ1952628.1 ABC transporter ATP-binding protein [Arthrobacter sp. zg-Y238]